MRTRPVNNKNKKDYIYVAYLDGCRKYIGHTTNIQRRIWEHLHHQGSKVTRKYKPHHIQVLEVVPHRYGRLEEINMEKRFERRYGKNCVRGGRREHAYNF